MVTEILICPEFSRSLAVIWIVSSVELTNVVVTGPDPFPTATFTSEPLIKPVPVMVRVKAEPPSTALVGDMLVIEGTGLLAEVTFNVSVALFSRLPEVPVTVNV